MDGTNCKNRNDFLLMSLKTFENTICNNIKQIESGIDGFNKKVNKFLKPILKYNEKSNKFIGKYLENYQLFSNKDNLSEEEIKNKIKKDEINLNNELSQMNNKLDLIDKLLSIDEYKIIINNINNKDIQINDNELEQIINSESDNEEENIKEIQNNINNINNKPKNNDLVPSNKSNLLNKKRNRPLSSENNDKKKKSKSKDKKIKKRINGNDVLNLLKKKFKNSNYIKKITKTFIKRRLNHKVIYEQEFDYSDLDNIKINRLRTSGSKKTYKYLKIIIKYNKEGSEKISDVVSLIGGTLLQNSYCLLNDFENNTIEFGGKINAPLFDIIHQYFESKILGEKYNINYAKIYSYEFFEELVNEYDKNNPNVKINLDEKVQNKLAENWKMLSLVRDFVEGCRNENNRIH